MKKIVVLLLAVILSMACFGGCESTDRSNNITEDPTDTEQQGQDSEPNNSGSDADPDESKPDESKPDDSDTDEPDTGDSEPDDPQQSVFLTELLPAESVDGYCKYTYNQCCLSGRLLCNGFPVSEGISMHPGETTDASVTYDISKFDYNAFAVTVGKNDQQKDCSVIFSILVDGEEAYNSGKMKEAEMDFVVIDIAEADTLTLIVNNGGDAPSFDASTWAYPALSDSDDLAPVSVTLENVDYIIEEGTDPFGEDITAVVRYNTGAFERVNGDEISIAGFDCYQTGKQEIEVTYESCTFSSVVQVLPKENFIKICDAKQEEFVSAFPKGSAGIDAEDATVLAVAGINYKNGIGLYPVSEDEPAYVSFALNADYEYKFHAVLGKTRTGIDNEVIFKIIGSGDELWRSDIMFPGECVVVDLSIKNVSELTIVADCGDDGTVYDSVGIADAFLYSESEKITDDSAAEYISLTDLISTETVNGYCRYTINQACLEGDKFLLNGFPVETGISMHAGQTDEASITYDISQYDYDTFAVTIGKNDQKPNNYAEFYIYVDGVKKYESGLMKEDDMRFVTVDISNATSLKIAVGNGGDGISFDEVTWAYPVLINKEDLQPVSLLPENIDSMVKKGTEIFTEEVTAIVKYNTGAFERVTSNDLVVSGYNPDNTGLQTVRISYVDCVSTFDVRVFEEKDLIKLCEYSFEEFESYYPQYPAGIECDDGESFFAISGIRFASGIGLHPVSDTVPGSLTIDLGENDHGYSLHAVFGKTRAVNKGLVVFRIIGDGVEIWSSSELTAGEMVSVDLSVDGIRELQIVVEGTSDGILNDCSGIADAFLYR